MTMMTKAQTVATMRRIAVIEMIEAVVLTGLRKKLAMVEEAIRILTEK